MDPYKQLFESVTLQGPEGILQPRVKSATEEGDRASVLLWFYDAQGRPIDDNLTISVSTAGFSSADEGYRRSVLDAVRRWVNGVRDGEPLQVLTDLGSDQRRA